MNDVSRPRLPLIQRAVIRAAPTVREMNPAVVSVTFDNSTAPHRVLVKFSEDVSASLDVFNLSLDRRSVTPGGPDTHVAVSLLGYDHATNVATFRPVSGSSGTSAAGVLANGNYRATILPAGIADVAGATLGLLIGGLLAAPLGAWAAKHFPAKQMLIMVGVVLTLTSAFGVYRAWG